MLHADWFSPIRFGFLLDELTARPVPLQARGLPAASDPIPLAIHPRTYVSLRLPATIGLPVPCFNIATLPSLVWMFPRPSYCMAAASETTCPPCRTFCESGRNGQYWLRIGKGHSQNVTYHPLKGTIPTPNPTHRCRLAIQSLYKTKQATTPYDGIRLVIL